MAVVNGTTGLVVSWGSNTDLISNSNAPMEFSLDVDAPEIESTAFNSTAPVS